jgi:tetratricopeptide (TPR) repeat protein
MKKLLFCLLSTLFSFGQSGIDSITFYIQKGEVNKAIQYGLKVKNQLELDNKKNTVYYANFLIDIGKMYSNQFRNAEAENYFIQGISILKDSLGENNLEYASKLYDFAFIYSFSEFSYKAEPLIIKSLTIRKEILGENSQEYLKSLNQLANYYYYKKNYLKAEPYLTEAIEKTKIIYGSDSNKLEDLLYNLAIIFEKQKKYEKSEKLWLEFISSKRKNDKLNRLKKTIFSLDDYICFVGNFYSNANNFNEAEKYFKEAIDYRLIFKGKDGNYSFLLGKFIFKIQ